MRVIVRAYVRGDEEDPSSSPCGYAEGDFFILNDSVIRRLKREARRNLQSMISLEKYERVKYTVEVKY